MHPKILTLHKYYLNANYMRTIFDKYLKERDKSIPALSDPHILGLMSLWYGCLYVVIEGWQDSKFKDQKVDLLLQSPLVQDLKGFRHDTFHFQKEYFAKRSVKFMSQKESAIWARSLNKEFGRFFLMEFRKAQK